MRSDILNYALPRPKANPVAPQPWTSSSNIINMAVPNGASLTRSASNNVGAELNGLPGTDVSRRASAYFGANSGMGGSDFVRNRGFDLYGQQADARKQQGFQDLLALISGTTAPNLQQRSQDIQQNQFGANLAEQQREFDQNYALQRYRYGPKFSGLVGTTSYGPGAFGAGAGNPTGYRENPAYSDWIKRWGVQ